MHWPSGPLLLVLAVMNGRVGDTWLSPRLGETAGGALGTVLLFGPGHYVFGKSWSELLGDHDLSRGRIWILVLVVTLVTLAVAARLRGLT